MTNKWNPIVKCITSITLLIVLTICTVIPAFAAGFAEGQDSEHAAKAAITKVYKVPVNTTVPASTFTFTLTKVGVGDKTDDTTKGNMPALGTNGSGSVTVTYSLNQTETFVEGSTGTKYLVKQSEDILASILADGTDWKAGPGIYKYTVKEVQSGIPNTTIPAGANDKEFAAYSEAVYDIDIWVEEDIHGHLFARYIVGFYKEGTPDEYYKEDGIDNGDKLDPTPGTETNKPGTPPEIGQKYSSIIFTNRYWKTDGPVIPPTDPNLNALEITKKVEGLNPNYDSYFDFDVTVITPAAVGNSTKTYNAYIIDASGNYVALGVAGNPNTKSGTDGNNRDFITLASETEKTIQLKHEERLVFFDLEVGAEVKVNETIAANTRVKYQHTFGNNANIEFNMPAGRTGQWGFPNDISPDLGPHYTKEGVSANIATFTNTVGSQPPTGISMNDMPYIVLIGIAIIGLVSFVTVKFRKRANSVA